MKREPTFIKRNLVCIVILPLIGAFHYGWVALQNNEVFVPKHERRDLPILEMYESAKKRLFKE